MGLGPWSFSILWFLAPLVSFASSTQPQPPQDSHKFCPERLDLAGRRILHNNPGGARQARFRNSALYPTPPVQEMRYRVADMKHRIAAEKRAGHVVALERELRSLEHQRDLLIQVERMLHDMLADPQSRDLFRIGDADGVARPFTADDIDSVLRGIIDSDLGKMEEFNKILSGKGKSSTRSRQLFALLGDGTVRNPGGSTSKIESLRNSDGSFDDGLHLVNTALHAYKNSRADMKDKNFLPSFNPDFMREVHAEIPMFNRSLLHEYPGYTRMVTDAEAKLTQINRIKDRLVRQEHTNRLYRDIAGRIQTTAFHNGPGFHMAVGPLQGQIAGFWGKATRNFAPGALKAGLLKVAERADPAFEADFQKMLGSLPSGMSRKQQIEAMSPLDVWKSYFAGTVWVDELGRPSYLNAKDLGGLHSGHDRFSPDGWRKFFHEMTSGPFTSLQALKNLFLERSPEGSFGSTYQDAISALDSLAVEQNNYAVRRISANAISYLKNLEENLLGGIDRNIPTTTRNGNVETSVYRGGAFEFTLRKEFDAEGKAVVKNFSTEELVSAAILFEDGSKFVIDANTPKDEVAEAINRVLKEKLESRGYPNVDLWLDNR
jgi:hypothetical protein